MWPAFLGTLIGAIMGCGGFLTLSYGDAAPPSDVRIFATVGAILFGAIGAALGTAASAMLLVIQNKDVANSDDPTNERPF